MKRGINTIYICGMYKIMNILVITRLNTSKIRPQDFLKNSSSLIIHVKQCPNIITTHLSNCNHVLVSIETNIILVVETTKGIMESLQLPFLQRMNGQQKQFHLILLAYVTLLNHHYTSRNSIWMQA